MIEDIKVYEKQLKKEHRFSFSPQFKETIHVKESASTFIALAIKIIETLDWELVYYDNKIVKAIHSGSRNRSEEILISYDFGKVSIQSTSSSNSGMWDKGRNSIRVKLFIMIYHKIINEYSKEAIKEIESNQRKKDNWDDYIEPETLPLPKEYALPNFTPLIYSSLFLSLIIGGILAILPKFYVLVEFGIAIGLSFGFKQLMRVNNYTNFQKLKSTLSFSVVLIFLSSIFFQYIYFISNLEIGFSAYLMAIINQGVMLKRIHIHGLGIIIAFLFRIGFTLLIAQIRFFNIYITFLLERVPEEVVEFGLYLTIKGYSEPKMRAKLSAKGWETETQQNMVFEAIQAIINIKEEQKNSI